MNHVLTALLVLWAISGIAHRKALRALMPKVTITPLSVEDQLDCDIHAREVSS